MRIKSVKDLGLKVLWFDNMNNDDMKVVNDMTDLGLKMLWSEKILIRLKRFRLSRTKKLMIESKFESDEKKRWLDSKFKVLLCYALNSIFDSIIMITLGNWMLNDSKFDDAVAI